MYKIKYIIWLIVACMTTTIHANDICEEVEELNLNISVNGSTVGAGTEWANSCNYNQASVWYKFTTEDEGDYNIKINERIDDADIEDGTVSIYNDVLTLYSGNCANGFSGLTEMMCVNDDEFGFAGENLYVNLDANTTYYIMVSSADCLFGKTEGEFSIKVKKGSRPTVTGEECDGAIEIFEGSCIEAGSNIGASKANPQPSCYEYTGASVWYVTVATSDKIQLSTAPNFSEIVTVYESDIPTEYESDGSITKLSELCGDMTEIACKMNKIPYHLEEGEVYQDELIITGLESGQAYFIQITGTFASIEADYNNSACDDDIPYIALSMSDVTCPSTDPPTACNDNNPNTINDQWNENCECIGTCANILGTVCDDGNPNTGDVDNHNYDYWDSNCNCTGTCHVQCPQDQPLNETTCECECTLTINDCYENGEEGEDYYLDENCTCQTCPTAGTTCDDGYYYTTNDRWTEWCTCVGELPDFCPADLTIYDEDVTNEGYFQTSNSIITDDSKDAIVVVDENEQFTLNAKKYITLKPGFNAKAKSNFRAYIKGCDFDLKTDESTFASVKHYPNPFRDEVTLEFKLDLDADIEIMITDVNGRIVSRLSIDNLYRGIQTRSISTQDWVPGIYFYQALIKEQQTGTLSHANGTLVKM